MKTKYPLRWDYSTSKTAETSKSELHLQSQLVQWFYSSYPEYRICTIPGSARDKSKTQPLRTLLFHNLNNAKSVVEASKLSAAGMVSGTPDLKLAVARGPYHGLYIELKLEGYSNRPKPEQYEVMDALIAQGYACEWVNTLEDGKQLIIDYLAIVN